MEKFKELVSLCKGSVAIAVNPHKDVYDTVDDYISPHEVKEIDPVIYAEMCNRDIIVIIQAYTTPVGSYSFYHYDIDMAIDEALRLIKSERPTT